VCENRHDIILDVLQAEFDNKQQQTTKTETRNHDIMQTKKQQRGFLPGARRFIS